MKTPEMFLLKYLFTMHTIILIILFDDFMSLPNKARKKIMYKFFFIASTVALYFYYAKLGRSLFNA